MTISPTARIPGETTVPAVAPALLATSAPAKYLKLSKICGCAIMISKFKVYSLLDFNNVEKYGYLYSAIKRSHST